jgi:DNA gyrase subunit B
MYTRTENPLHIIQEVIENASDEALGGYGKNIIVTLHKDGSVSVEDDGRGIPTSIHPKLGVSALEVVMTVLHAGGKFDKDTYKVSGGLHGVGVSCVNALSTHLKAEVHRDGKITVQEFNIGKPMYPAKEVGDTNDRGTTVTFTPDLSIFTVHEYNYTTLANRIRELSFLNKGITITLVDERQLDENGKPVSETFHSEGGLREFVMYLDDAKEKLIEEPIYMENDKGAIPVEVAMMYNTSYSENIQSYVNNINNF